MRYSRLVRRTDLHPGQSELAGRSASDIPLRIDLPEKRRRHTFGRHEAVDRLAVLGVGLADPGWPSSSSRGVQMCSAPLPTLSVGWSTRKDRVPSPVHSTRAAQDLASRVA
jgi:hypothetical protein